MKFSVFSKSVVGYKNKIVNKSSQDYLIYKNLENGVLCAVADGHSGDYFIFSHKGSRFACEAFVEIMEEYINNEDSFDYMITSLSKKNIQKDICNRWKNTVYNDFKNNLPRAYRTDYFRYGTTLLGVYINEDYRLYIKIGDGEILVKRYNEFEKVFTLQRKGLVDTLAQQDAYEKVQSKIEKVNKINNDFPIVIYSDGYENSFLDYKSMINNMEDTIYNYKKNIFSRRILEENYEKELTKLSIVGSKDDISIAFVNIL